MRPKRIEAPVEAFKKCSGAINMPGRSAIIIPSLRWTRAMSEIPRGPRGRLEAS